MNYRFSLRVNWIPAMNETELRTEFQSRRQTEPTRRVNNSPIGALPARLWENLVSNAGIFPETIWTTLTRAGMNELIQQLRATQLEVDGKSLNKDEFVTCGGVRLREINFKTMESRVTPNLYFAGELLDIDGITGGSISRLPGQAVGLPDTLWPESNQNRKASAATDAIVLNRRLTETAYNYS